MTEPRPEGGTGTPAAFDARSAQVVVVAERGTWTLDVCTNTWRRMHARTPEIFAFSTLVSDAGSHLVVPTLSITDSPGFLWTYSADNDVWSKRSVRGDGEALKALSAGRLADAVYDPVRDVVIFRDGQTGYLWTYDVHSQALRRLDGAPGPTDGTNQPGPRLQSLMTYDTARGEIVLLLMGGSSGGEQTWLFRVADRQWVKAAETAPLSAGEPWAAWERRALGLNTGWVESGGEIVYDAAADRVIVLSDGKMASFDREARVWRDIALPHRLVGAAPGASAYPDGLAVGPLARIGHRLVYDSVNERVLVIGGQIRAAHGGWEPATDVLAYRLRTNSWTELIPSRSQD